MALPTEMGQFMPMEMETYDPNDPRLFQSNMRIVHNQVLRMQAAARTVLAGIRGAYLSGNTPTQTATDIQTLHQALSELEETLRQTGVGGLPIIVPSMDQPLPTEAQLIEDTSKDVDRLFERLKKAQEGAGIVANLLSGPVS